MTPLVRSYPCIGQSPLGIASFCSGTRTSGEVNRRPTRPARSAFWLAATHSFRHEAAKLLRLPRVGLHLRLGKIALQPQDVLQVLSLGQLAGQREASVGVFLCELNRSLLNDLKS